MDSTPVTQKTYGKELIARSTCGSAPWPSVIFLCLTDCSKMQNLDTAYSHKRISRTSSYYARPQQANDYHNIPINIRKVIKVFPYSVELNLIHSNNNSIRKRGKLLKSTDSKASNREIVGAEIRTKDCLATKMVNRNGERRRIGAEIKGGIA